MAEERRTFCTRAWLITLGGFLFTAMALVLAFLPLLECHACDGTGNVNTLLPVKLRTQNPALCKNCEGSCRVNPLNRGLFEVGLWLVGHNLLASQGCPR